MGPFVPPRQKADWEFDALRSADIERIMQRVFEGADYEWQVHDRLHGGRWVTEVLDGGDQRHRIVCRGLNYQDNCDHVTDWVPNRNGGLRNLAMRQWSEHRVRVGLREGVPL